MMDLSFVMMLRNFNFFSVLKKIIIIKKAFLYYYYPFYILFIPKKVEMRNCEVKEKENTMIKNNNNNRMNFDYFEFYFVL